MEMDSVTCAASSEDPKLEGLQVYVEDTGKGR